MRKCALLASLLVLTCPAFAGFGSWTLYYSDTEVVNQDGSVTLTPTLSLTGSDGGLYCDPLVDCDGREQAFVMLNGNAWQASDLYDAIGQPGYQINFSYTFPSVTVGPGQTVDLSYAAKVAGASHIIPGGGQWISVMIDGFYTSIWVNGRLPKYSPAPCWLGGIIGLPPAPGCTTPWPSAFDGLPRGWHPADLDSQQVAQVFTNS